MRFGMVLRGRVNREKWQEDQLVGPGMIREDLVVTSQPEIAPVLRHVHFLGVSTNGT